MPTTRSKAFPKLLTFALTLTILSLAASDASAQHFERYKARLREFYGPIYDERGYADSLGLRGHKRLENGGYYGPPQIYSRQFGTVAGYRLDPPFAPFRPYVPSGPPGSGY
jgi:hypothetical protein